MAIFTRFVRLCKADIHGVMDQAEDKGLMLKQCLREMEEEIARKEATLRNLATSRDCIQKESEKYTRGIENLEKDLKTAMEKDRDDISRFLIRKLKPMTRHRDELGRHLESVNSEIEQFLELAEEQRQQYDSVKLRAAEYFHRTERETWKKTLPDAAYCTFSSQVSEAEIELELLRRKEQMKGGN
ncbi:PspA/IM30 family protein [Desulfococcaceae bacterium HSG8]|nr:PspA/IM30 family protein [Desulfococcaceae bacterium HSG8]